METVRDLILGGSKIAADGDFSHEIKRCLLLGRKKNSKVKSLSHVRLFVTSWAVAYQASLSMGFSRRSTWVGCRFLLQGIVPAQRLNPGLPHCRRMLYPLSHQGSPWKKSYDKPAAAAKSLQSCLTLCDPVDCSPPGLPVPGILQARILEWVAIVFSNPYMTTGKTIALTRWTFVGKVMSLLFNMLSMLVMTFLPRSKHLLISWLKSPYAVILEPKNIKSVTVSTVSPSFCHEVVGPDAVILVFWMLSFKPFFNSPLPLSSGGLLVLHFMP